MLSGTGLKRYIWFNLW